LIVGGVYLFAIHNTLDTFLCVGQAQVKDVVLDVSKDEETPDVNDKKFSSTFCFCG